MILDLTGLVKLSYWEEPLEISDTNSTSEGL